ncbi:hypothetical protein [Streptomyces albipurpureus]|uniref:Uncharacterized protein n=1 Tax=Streptomyces albipurpureus TaxID=2897419 RepID=A0ABT0ULM1_9ACTN|nr:hypothetical protein [Streptomyces sp. CWNU-1]MCM2389518.1 hypothetical protein [Streptomyces sp. CWNU-1]
MTALLIRGESRAERLAEPRELTEVMRSRQRPDTAGHTGALVHLHAVEGPDRVHAALFMEAADPVEAECAAFDFVAGLLADHRAVGWVLAAFGRAEPPDINEPRGRGPKCRWSAPPCP